MMQVRAPGMTDNVPAGFEGGTSESILLVVAVMIGNQKLATFAIVASQ